MLTTTSGIFIQQIMDEVILRLEYHTFDVVRYQHPGAYTIVISHCQRILADVSAENCHEALRQALIEIKPYLSEAVYTDLLQAVMAV